MNLKHPELIPLLLLLPALIVALGFIWKRRNQALDQLCDASKLSNLFPKNSSAKTLLRYFLITVAMTMFLAALISPRWGYEWQEVETKGTNIIIALDVSKSMLAKDISPNRLTRAKLELNKLIDKLTGDRLGLIIFAGESFLQSPLTHDYLMVRDWLSKISINSVAVPGTSIKSAIDLARKSFKHIDSEGKVLIVVSDGEEHDEATVEEAKKAKAEGIKICSIGIGTAKGSPIESPAGLVRDQSDNVVISKLDDTLLKEISEASGGNYVRSSTGDFHLDQLYYEYIKEQVADEVLKSGKTKKWYETYQIFMAIALLALVLEILLSLDMGIFALIKSLLRSNKGNVFRLPIIALCVLSASPVQASIFDLNLWGADSKLQDGKFSEAKDDYLKIQVREPHNSRLNYNLGVAHYREAAFQQAVNTFSRAAVEAESEALKEKSLYNLGNSFFKLEDYKKAISAYEEALKIDPNDEDAKHNLELAKKKLEEEKQEDKDDQNQDQNQDQQDKDQNKDQDQNQDQQDKENQDENQDQKDQDSEQDQQKQQQPQNQQNQKDQKDLSQKDIQNLLRQVQEADPAQVQQMMRGQQQVSPTNKLNPW